MPACAGKASPRAAAAPPDEADPSNRSSVWTPLLHAVWKPDPTGRDQVRISLTRSYRSPMLGDLIARPRVNTTYAPPGPNTPTQPDRAGNPELRPELATGIDVAVERYLPGSGLLSANVFRRNLSDYMRSVTRLETVSYASVPRYVLRTQNVGDGGDRRDRARGEVQDERSLARRRRASTCAPTRACSARM